MSKKLLFIDNFDSFTYNLVDYFCQEGIHCVVKRNDEDMNKILSSNFDGVVLSPGPGIPKNSGMMMELIHHYHSLVPILGICLGHQAIGEYFGAKLKKAKIPMHGKRSRIYCTNDVIFENIPTNFNVVRYHSMIIDNLPEELVSLAKTKDEEIMLMKHKKFPIYGIQYHPEAYLTEYGNKIIQNWIQLVKKGN